MNARYSAITPSQEDTFHWNYNESVERPWDSFTDWLRSPDKDFY